MKKRIFAVLLAATMVMGMSMTALADDQGDGTTVTVGSSVEAANVKISVPTDANFVMNPFSLPVGEDEDAPTDQIISDNIEVQNLGNTAVSMTVSATVALADSKNGKTVLITDATKINDADAKTGLVAKNAVVKVGLKKAEYDSENTEYVPSDTFFQNGSENVQVVMAKFGTAQSLAAIKLAKPDTEADTDVDSRAFVDITGVLANKASTAWLSTDNLQVTLKFNLVPTVISE